MSLHLPKTIEQFFKEDKSPSEIFAQNFTQDAILLDEGKTHIGAVAIKKWKDDVSIKYQYTIEPYAMENLHDKVIVLTRVEGNFVQSPINLRYTFELRGDKISSLEITV